MSPETGTYVEIALGVIGALMQLSRFLQSAKPIWARLPKWAAVLIPAVVAVIPSVTELFAHVKTLSDLTNSIVAAIAIVVIGIFPTHEPAPVDPPVPPMPPTY